MSPAPPSAVFENKKMRRNISAAFFCLSDRFAVGSMKRSLRAMPLRLQLLADWQHPDTLAGRGKDGVGQCRGEGRQAGLADAAWRPVRARRHEVYAGPTGGAWHACTLHCALI